MSQVEFEEFNIPSRHNYDTTPKIVRWVINYSGGLVKGEAQANYVLLVLVVSVVIFSFSILNYSKGNKVEEGFVISPEESIGSEQGIYKR